MRRRHEEPIANAMYEDKWNARSDVAHRSKLESNWISDGVRSRVFSLPSANASAARISLARLDPTRARVRSTPSSTPSPLTPQRSSCAYVLRTWNASGSSPSEGTNDSWLCALSGELVLGDRLGGVDAGLVGIVR